MYKVDLASKLLSYSDIAVLGLTITVVIFGIVILCSIAETIKDRVDK